MNEFSVTVQREIAASPEELFDAWLDARSLGSWLRPSGIRQTRAETDPREGGTFRIVMADDESSILHSGTYREIDRPRRLVFTWSSPATRFRDSVVTVTFRPSSGATVVEIHQVGLPDEEARTSHHAGWSDCLRALDRIRTRDED
ncbi:SRPBCC domain-containing protein [Actinomadura sp. WMMA1423]|uniref:SRPBCC family protein n=1 Tax=Actinomadura sp. WMMA1423 TaxID=2591108 RepID=UPI001146D306|nr:SRPBCC domain-containing protein [Actinomadura sp. WMMA1423]